jgi:hypothetical protein
MSEQIKSTVFRFATVRAPELLTEKEKSDHHIHHPNPTAQGFFANELASPAATQAAQRQALKAKAAGFAPLKTTLEVKAAVGGTFFDHAVWLAKNRAAVYTKQVSETGPTPPAALATAQLLSVWDNLLYQLITGEKPLLRQQCIELLVANGYIQAAGQPHQHQLAAARVIIPQAFYGGEADSPLARMADKGAAASAPIYTGDFQKITGAVIANEKIAGYRQLSQELDKAGKQYALQNKAAYEAARNTHEAAVRTAVENYHKDNPDTEGQKWPPGKGPAIPAFEFVPAPEMEATFLQANLSAKSFSLAQQLSLTDTGSFKAAVEKVDGLIKTAVASMPPTDIEDNRSLVVNNMLLPVNRAVLPLNETHSFFMLGFTRDDTNFSIFCTINMGTTGVHATGASYDAELLSGKVSGQSFVETATNNALTLEFFRGNEIPIPQGQTGFRFHGRIHTSAGYDLLFDVQFHYAEGASGKMTAEKQGGGTGGEDNGLAVPLGYGIKRLGLADYRRVEQTVCCYLPGEVSHIENIMAREYKERSSRRLTRSEDTSTLELSMEKETQKDSATTERYELQKEIESIVSKDTSAEAHASVSGGGKIRFDIGGSFAFNTSKQDSNRTAVDYSKEVTEKALERVVQKVREERTIKMIEEFEEQHKHGFDNRLGDKHVSGVYRWVDKVYKNQVFNYGKRLMYEFMVPEPASFHNAAMKVLAQSSNATVLQKPVDPRTAEGFYKMADHMQATDYTVAYWAGKYNAEVPALLDGAITVSKAFDMNVGEAAGRNFTGAKSFKMELPDGYEAVGASIGASFQFHPDADEWSHARVRVGDVFSEIWAAPNVDKPISFAIPIRKELAVSAQVRDLGGLSLSVMANCRRTAEAYRQWQTESFNAIITAYEDKLSQYEKAMAAYTQPQAAKETNPGFYRQIENTVLRKNCLSYLVTDAQMGKKHYGGTGTTDIQPLVTAEMDRYASMVKFVEQAFEWDIMSYRFYPFYWGNRQDWQKNYQVEVNDPLFRSFLQSGMARVVVSVRPGFEEAVMHFMATGQIWNGGQVPAIGDDLYLSIVEELKNPVYAIDETWETRVPTTLTILQAGSIGLVVDEGLPCDCGNDTGIETNENLLGNQLKSITNG